MSLANIPDNRSLSQQDVPYSAYCKICWYSVYAIWIGEPHGGVCPLGYARADECPDAMARAKQGAQLKAALSASAASTGEPKP